MPVEKVRKLIECTTKCSVGRLDKSYGFSLCNGQSSCWRLASVVYWTAGQTTKDLYTYKNIIFILRRRRLCEIEIQSESSHISFFCSEDPFSEVVQRPENTHEELTSLLEWPASLSLRLRDQQTSPFRIVSSGSLFQSKITDLIMSLKSKAEIWTSSSPHIFILFMAGYRNLYNSFFFFR